MAPPKRNIGATRAAVQALLSAGLRPAEVAKRLGIARPTVTYHARRLGLPVQATAGRRYDWEAIRAFYDEGHSYSACRERFGFSGAAWGQAVARGDIVPRRRGIPLDELLTGRRTRSHVRLRLIADGAKPACCERCGMDEWCGQAMPLELHHVNGDSRDNRLENLQVLCPNCHALTETWGGRNKGRAAAGRAGGFAPGVGTG